MVSPYCQSGGLPSELKGSQECFLRRKELSDEDAQLVCARGSMAVFQAPKLSVFEVDGFADLKSIHPEIVQLGQLLRLSYIHNNIEVLPKEIGRLQSLKYLDLSCNCLTFIPKELYQLPSLQTLILTRNSLKDDSFEPCSSLSDQMLPLLRCVDLSHNKLTEIPKFVAQADQVTELIAADNELTSVSTDLLRKGLLRVLSLARNRLSTIPSEVTELGKLKTLDLKENPIADKRLLKLIAQHGDTKPKAILDYIASKGPSPHHQAGKVKGKAGGGGVHAQGEDPGCNVVEVRRSAQPLVVTTTPAARQHRPYLLCTIVKRLDLRRPDCSKRFLSIQTNLHDDICFKRKLATIATHKMAAISPPLVYDAKPWEDVRLTPLGFEHETTGREFLSILQASKPSPRGGKKSQSKAKAGAQKQQPNPVAASLSKYLDLVEGSQSAAVLCDDDGTVISLPPLTNGSATILTQGVYDVLVEVSSSRSLPACMKVANALILEMIRAGMESTREDDHNEEPPPSLQRPFVRLVVEPVRVVDEEGSLLSVFPSRTDLCFDRPDIEVLGL